MAKNTIKTIAATTAITLAAVGTPAFADEVTPKVNASNKSIIKTDPSTGATTEPHKVTSDEVKNNVDAQKQNVATAQSQVNNATANATAADQAQAKAQNEANAANQAVKNAEANAAKATPKNIAANQADQVANLADQKANATETATTDAKIATQTEAVNNAQTDVSNAEQALKDANADVSAKEAQVQSAKNAISGTGLAQAEDKLAKATKALDSVDIVKIPDLTQFKEDKASGDDDFMTDSGATAIENTDVSIGKNAKDELVDIDNLTQAQKEEISHLYVQALNQIRRKLGVTNDTSVTKEMIDVASNRAKAYKERAQSPLTHGHISLLAGQNLTARTENLAGIASKSELKTMYDLKKAVIDALMRTSFADAPSKWGHLENNLSSASNVGLDIANINGQYWLVMVTADKGESITNPNNAEAIQKAYENAKAEKATAQTASENANDALKQASADYANALELKTSAEKTLTDATATPVQTAVAENNLRLAKLALESAQKRQAEAQKAVDNFSADLASKKQALDDAKSALKSAKRVQEQKVQALADAKTKLTKQESKLEALKAQKAKLVEEKDRLVAEAKALATELKGYLEAPAILVAAQTTASEKDTALKDAMTKAKASHTKLKELQAKLAEEQAKLAELQTKYDRLKDLEDKAKDNKIITLPDGTIIAIPNTAPTAEELSEFDINSLNKGLDDNKILAIDDKGNVTVNGQAYTSQQQASSKPIYSRVERAKTLPETGEHESWLAIFGVTILSVVCAVGSRKKN